MIKRNIFNIIQGIFYSMALLLMLVACNKTESLPNSVKKGSFSQTITETGELVAVDARSFVMPRYGRYWYNMKIIGLIDHGTAVKAGDSLIQFDPSEINKFIIERETQLENEKANLSKLIVQQSSRLSDLTSSLQTEEATFNLKKLEMEQSRFESDRIQQIKKLEFQQAEITIEKVRRRIELNEIIALNDLKIQQIRVSRIENEIAGAYEVLSELTIRTPIPGIFQIANKRRSRELLRVGDEVSFGNVLGNVPDLTWMKVNTLVNETDITKIQKGQRVLVRLDALPDVFFEGELSFISILCRPYENTRRKVFDVEVKLLVSDERLKPGMTVSCEIISKQLENVLYVANNCLVNIDNQFWVYRKKTNGYEKVPVQLVSRNNTHSAIEGDISRGQVLIPVDEISNIQNQ